MLNLTDGSKHPERFRSSASGRVEFDDQIVKRAMAETTDEIKAADYGQGLSPEEATSQALINSPAQTQAGRARQAEAGVEIIMDQRADAARLIHPSPTISDGREALTAEYASALQRLAELEELNEKLREQDRAKAGFISMVVHDIRSPLTVIMGTLDLLHEDLLAGRLVDEQHYQRLFTDSLYNCQEISRLIEDMLELARMREHRLPLNFERTACPSLIEQALAVASGAARQAGVTLSSELQPMLPPVFVDRNQLHRALMNLVNNAIKFTPHGGHVTIRALILEERRRDAPCDYVLLSVIDTGEGLSPAEAPYVFDAYWQAPNGRRKTGTGLGLAIVKRIAVAHGGNASVRSTPGKGSAFTIMIPVRDSAPDQLIELAE